MVEKNLPLVSIVVPVYNGEKYIKEALDSILEQDYPNLELFVLDDGSTDNTIDILKEYKKKFFWETHKNRGQAGTLNKGFQMAKGELLAYLSADDTLLPNAISRSVQDLMSRKDLVLTYCDYYLIDSGSNVIRRVHAPDFNYYEMVVKIICPPGPGAVFKREAFEKTGPWDSRLRQVPDYDYWIRLGLQGDFLRIPEPLANFRVHKNSQSYAGPDKNKSEEIVEVMKRYFQSQEIPATLKAVQNEALSNANIIAARFHLRAGRYRMMFDNLFKAWHMNFLSFLTLRTVKLLLNGLAYRIRNGRM